MINTFPTKHRMRLYLACVGVLMAMYAKGVKSLTDSDLPELNRWALEYHTGLIRDTIQFNISPLPTPDFPASDDYHQFCDVLKLGHDSTICLALFKELFVTDFEDHITGVRDQHSDITVKSVIYCEYESYLEDTFKAIAPEDLVSRYGRMRPWIKDVIREMTSFDVLPQNRGDPTSYFVPMGIFYGVCTRGPHSFYYLELLVEKAIKHNFPETDPTGALLLGHIQVLQTREPTEVYRWFRVFEDYSKTFDPDLLTALKPGLLAYAKDLKELK